MILILRKIEQSRRDWEVLCREVWVITERSGKATLRRGIGKDLKEMIKGFCRQRPFQGRD